MKKPDVLRNREDFNNLYRKGKSSGSKYVVVFYIKNNLNLSRKAFLASKKVGNSVARNRARRLMKEAFRQLEDSLPAGYDILFIARNTITQAKCDDVLKSIRGIFIKAGFLPQSR